MAEQGITEVLPVEDHLQLVDWGRFELNLFDVNPTELSEEAAKLPALIAFWGVRLADAESLQRESKFELERVEAEAYGRIKRSLRREEADGQRGRVTEGDVNAQIKLDPKVQKAQNTLLEDEHRFRQYRAVVSALHGKQSMTSSRIGLMRTELEATMQTQRFDAAKSNN